MSFKVEMDDECISERNYHITKIDFLNKQDASSRMVASIIQHNKNDFVKKYLKQKE